MFKSQNRVIYTFSTYNFFKTSTWFPPAHSIFKSSLLQQGITTENRHVFSQAAVFYKSLNLSEQRHWSWRSSVQITFTGEIYLLLFFFAGPWFATYSFTSVHSFHLSLCFSGCNINFHRKMSWMAERLFQILKYQSKCMMMILFPVTFCSCELTATSVAFNVIYTDFQVRMIYCSSFI